MRTAVVVLTLALVASVAAANPVADWPTVALSFDQTEHMPVVNPAAYSSGEVYLSAHCFGMFGESLVTISLAVAVDPGVSAPVAWTSLLPGGLSIGDYETGITLSSTEPLTDDKILVCSGSLFYLGVPGQIAVVDHPDYPRWITNAEDEVLFYCLHNNAGVLMTPTPTGEDCALCQNGNPVEHSSWGAIKAMYR